MPAERSLRLIFHFVERVKDFLPDELDRFHQGIQFF